MRTKYQFREEQIREIEQVREKNKDPKTEIKLRALEMRAKGAKLKDAAEATGLRIGMVKYTIARYRDHGIEAVIAPTHNQFSKEQIWKIEQAREKAKDPSTEEKLRALEMWVKGATLKDAAKATGLHVGKVQYIAARYREHGIEVFINRGHHNDHRRNMSEEKEAAFLEDFQKRMEKGESVYLHEIKEAYQKAVGHPTSISQIYNVLHRHGWKKSPAQWRKAETSDAERAGEKENAAPDNGAD